MIKALSTILLVWLLFKRSLSLPLAGEDIKIPLPYKKFDLEFKAQDTPNIKLERVRNGYWKILNSLGKVRFQGLQFEMNSLDILSPSHHSVGFQITIDYGQKNSCRDTDSRNL